MITEITDDSYKKQIIFLLNNFWSGRTDNYFPLQTYINLERNNFEKLVNYNYIIIKKNIIDKKRAILFSFFNSSGEEVTVIIFKDFVIYNLNIKCSHDHYYGSLFDISYSEEGIIISDTFMIGGNKINNLTYTERINESGFFVKNIISSDINISVIDIITKNRENFRDLHENEELFFVPNDLPLTTGINYSCFKWKPVDTLTFSLLVVENENDIDLYTTNFKQTTIFAKISGKTPYGLKDIEEIKALENYKNECIIDFNINKDRIVAISVNKERHIQNSVRSIEKILHIKKENIKIDDIMNLGM